MTTKGFLRTEKADIVDCTGRKVALRGVNLGGWLMMEGYMLHSISIPEQSFKKEFTKVCGTRALKNFEKSFRDNFIREDDFKTIAHIGFNCIRLPFNCRLIEKKPYYYDKNGISYLDNAIYWAKKYNIKVILDLHAAHGAQSCDWHADSLGKAELWTKPLYRERASALWEFIAHRYKDEVSVAGYDLLNESVIENTRLLNSFYKQLIRRIRSVDKNHILFVEGNNWATDLKCLDEFSDDNITLSIHAYQPWNFTLNFIPQLKYPMKKPSTSGNRLAMERLLACYARIAQKRKRPVFVGEFGVNNREGKYGEDVWLKDILRCFKKFDFHWTYWTYKAVKNSIFPDGIFSYMDNPPWVHRQGPVMGWAAYKYCWPGRKKDMISSWRTGCFRRNEKIFKVLADAVR